MKTIYVGLEKSRFGGGWKEKEEKYFSFPSPSPILLFQPNTHSLGNIFFSPQASSEMNPRWRALSERALARQNKVGSLAKIHLYCRLLITGPAGNSEFCFPLTSIFISTSPRGTLRVPGKQNSPFPLGPVTKCFLLHDYTTIKWTP